MKETSFNKIKSLADDFQSQGKDWHFHMLSPKCIFNEKEKKHAFVLENASDDKTYVAYSDEKNAELGEELVKKLHGDQILNEKESEEGVTNKNVRKIIRRARELNEKGITWHHHMLFPDCIFNEFPDKWCIIFEDPESKEKVEVLYDEEPSSDLKKIEELFYAQ